MCMYVCVCVCVRACVCACVCMCVYVYVCGIWYTYGMMVCKYDGVYV